MTDDPTNYRKYKLVDDLDLLSDEAFEALSHEQIVLYLARAGQSPLDVQASLDRALQMVDDYQKDLAATLGARR